MAIGISGCVTIAIAFGGIGIDGKAWVFAIGIHTNPKATGFVAATLIAYDRLCREDLAKDTARFLSIEYDKVIEHLDRHDPAKAQRIIKADEKINFKELKNTDFANFTDDQPTEFLDTAGQYSKDFREVKQAIFKVRHDN